MFQVQEKNALNEEILNDDDLTSLFVRKLHRFIFLSDITEKSGGDTNSNPIHHQ